MKRLTIVLICVLAYFLCLHVESSVHAATPGPTITIMSPADGKTIWSDGASTYPVRIVFSANDADGVNTGSFKISVDGGAFSGITVGNYGYANSYYYDWIPTAGSHTIQIQGNDGAGSPSAGNSRKVTINVRVAAINNYSTLPGDGKLLVRDNDNTMCMACHAIKTHSSTDIGSTKYGNWERICRDCHTPHNTRNIFLLQSSFKIYTGTNQTFAYRKKVDFRNLSGESRYGLVSKTPGAGQLRRGPCEACHTRTSNADGTARWRNNTSLADTEGVQFVSGLPKHNADQNCTNCHKHNVGFAGAESKGNQLCSGCHRGLFTVMSSGNNLFHHYMNNSRVDTLASGSKYPVTNTIMGSQYGNANRRCLMCHVDHDIFASSTSTKKRAGNLRLSIMALPTYATAQRTDFTNQTSTSQGIWGGLCMSCHRLSQEKYTTMLGKDGSKQTPVIPFPGGTPYDYTQTAHGSYTVPASFKTDGSRFNANCLKCHNDALKKTKQAGSGTNPFGTRTSSFGTHGSPVRRLQALMGDDYEVGQATGFDTASTIIDTTKSWTPGQWEGTPVSITFGKGANQGRVIEWNTANKFKVNKPWDINPDATSKYNINDPVEENLCYHCHSTNTQFNPYTARDYYGKKEFDNDKAKKIHQVFTDGWPTPPIMGTISSISSTIIKVKRPLPQPAPWTANQWVNYLVLMKSGRAQGMSQLVNANDAVNSITLKKAFKRTPRKGDKFVIQKNPYRHQIDAYVGKHRTDEYFLAESGPTKTPAGWYGSDQHVGCTDCHNPHGARPQGVTQGHASNDAFTTPSSIYDPTQNWPVNRWRGYVVRIGDKNYTSMIGQVRLIQTNTSNRLQLGGVFLAGNNSAKAPKGSYYVVQSSGKPPTSVTGNSDEGNDINNANYGVWGVDVNYANITAAPIATNNLKYAYPIEKNPVFTKMPTVQKVYQICFKCHSDYGWGNNGPRMEIPDSLGTSSGSFDNGTSTNIAREFNPNNLSHHAILAPGNNQPISKANYFGQATGGSAVKKSIWVQGAGWTAGQWVDKYMTIIKGAGSNATTSYQKITFSSSSSIGFATALAVVPNSTTYFAIGTESYLNPAWPYYKTGISIDTSGNATITGSLPGTVIPGWYLYAGSRTKPPAGTISGSNAFTGWFQVKSITDNTHFTVTPAPPVAFNNFSGHITAGLGNNFVPPYGPWSVISCADCHGSDRDDPSGPHASAKMWIRRDLDTKISFDWMNGSNGTGTVTRVNYYTMGFGSSDLPNLCINCHRTDVYGQNGSIGGSTSARSDMARVSHLDLRNADSNISGGTTTYGIICMMCHGGDAMGSIHGSNQWKGPNGTSYRGRRMMNGAAWNGYVRGATQITCYNNRANSAVTSCNEGSNGTVSTNYSYIGGADGRTVP